MREASKGILGVPLLPLSQRSHRGSVADFALESICSRIVGRDLRSDQNCFGLQSLQTCWHQITCRQESDVETRRRNDRANRVWCKGMEPSMCDQQLWQASVLDNKVRMAVVVSMLPVAELPLFENSSTQLAKGLEAATWWCWMSWQRLFWRVFWENRSSRKLI